MLNKVLISFGLLIVLINPLYADSQGLSDGAVRKAIIQNSINSYPGNCPCPYNSASNGSRCGKRSAWSRPGGYAPLCYPKDVSDTQVKQYKHKYNK